MKCMYLNKGTMQQNLLDSFFTFLLPPAHSFSLNLYFLLSKPPKHEKPSHMHNPQSMMGRPQRLCAWKPNPTDMLFPPYPAGLGSSSPFSAPLTHSAPSNSFSKALTSFPILSPHPLNARSFRIQSLSVIEPSVRFAA